MNRYYFISLGKERQLELLRIRGRLLHQKMKPEYLINLYQLENFYIELWENQINHQTFNLVIHKDRTLINFPFNQVAAA